MLADPCSQDVLVKAGADCTAVDQQGNVRLAGLGRKSRLLTTNCQTALHYTVTKLPWDTRTRGLAELTEGFSEELFRKACNIPNHRGLVALRQSHGCVLSVTLLARFRERP